MVKIINKLVRKIGKKKNEKDLIKDFTICKLCFILL